MVEKCINCGAELAGKFCYKCGQKKFDKSQKTVGHLVHDAFHFMTHLDGNIWHSIKAIFTRPGKLSLEFGNGKQKYYFKPISLFLLIVVIYLTLPMLTGMNMPLKYHQGMPVYGTYVKKSIEKKMNEAGMTKEGLEEKYYEKSSKVSKVLLLLLIPLSALVTWVLFFGRKVYFYDHLLLATEINTFYLFMTYLLLPLLLWPLSLLSAFKLVLQDQYYTIISTTIFFVFSLLAFKYFFKEKWSVISFKTMGYVFLHFMFVQLIYRFLQFQISFLMTH